MKQVFIFLLMTIILTAAGPSGAQTIADELLGTPKTEAQPVPDAGVSPAPAEKKKSLPLSEVPDAYLIEAQALYDRCETTPKLRNYYNCECLSVKFLDRRIEKGAKYRQDAIMLDLSGECADATGATGKRYTECMNSTVNMPRGTDPEEYCSCYANTFAKLYERYGAQPSSKTFVNVGAQAMIACRDPALAKKMYPVNVK